MYTPAKRSMNWICGRWPAEIVVSNPTEGMNGCLLRVPCVFRYMSLRRATPSFRAVPPTVVRRCV
jgi:hypothetical protein